MNRKQKKELRQRQSTRQLMGVEQLTGHGLKTAGGELVFYLVQPDNLSVLSAGGVQGRVQALSNLLSGTDNLYLLALDSRESFQDNKDYYHQRLGEEVLPAIRELLRLDMEHLDDIQSATASSREFAFVHCIEKKADADLSQPARMEKRIRDYGFHVRKAKEQDVRRLLAVYYQQDVTTELFDGVDGERWVKEYA